MMNGQSGNLSLFVVLTLKDVCALELTSRKLWDLYETFSILLIKKDFLLTTSVFHLKDYITTSGTSHSLRGGLMLEIL